MLYLSSVKTREIKGFALGKGLLMLKLKKNDVIELEITGYTAEGNGVGRARGELAVFVPGAAAGDRLLVRIVKLAKNYAFGKIEEILAPSPDRREQDCPVFRQCGGCAFRHIAYEAELCAKERRVRDALERIGGFENVALRPIMGAGRTDGYRNKAQLPLGRSASGELLMGFYALHSHRIVACDGCLLQPPAFLQAMRAVKQWFSESGESVYDEQTGRGTLRHLYLRQAHGTGEVLACLVANGSRLKKEQLLADCLRGSVPGLAGVVLNINRKDTNVVLGPECRVLWGKGTLLDRLCGLCFEISPLSFYQVNHDQAERLYEKAAEYAGLSGGETVLDLYCGTGTIGLSMARAAGRVIGVELVAQAVENARQNAERNNIENAEFYCEDAVAAAARLQERGLKPDVVVLDPPRKGCGEFLPETVARMAPEKIVYVSCDPATLARDVKRFTGLGYRFVEAAPVDMFPRTAHVECVVLMTKVQN